MSRPRILFAASEMAPLIKTGGLADVAGSLSCALSMLDCDVRVVLPFYGDLANRVDRPRSIARTQLHGHDVEVFETVAEQGQRVWLVASPLLFGRTGNPYIAGDGKDWPDNADRFAVFSRAIVWLATRPADSRLPSRCRASERLADGPRGATASPRAFRAADGVQHSQPRLPGKLRPRDVRSHRASGRSVVDRWPRVPRPDVVHQRRHRIRRPSRNRQPDLCC